MISKLLGYFAVPSKLRRTLKTSPGLREQIIMETEGAAVVAIAYGNILFFLTKD